MSLILPFSQACERNKDAILEIIAPCARNAQTALEIGSGTGQHVVHFAHHLPQVVWQPSDQAHYLDGIRAQISTNQLGNIVEPIEIDVTCQPWLPVDATFDMIYTANTLHIMSQSTVDAFFSGLADVCHENSVLVIYGPFKYSGRHTSYSNQAFDESLRARGEGSEIKELELVDYLAQQAGFDSLVDHAMPANNRCLVWQRADRAKDLT